MYLGLGAIVSVAVLVVAGSQKRDLLRRRDVWIWAVAIVLFLVAVSNDVAVGSREVLIPGTDSIQELRQVFRAGSRFAWLLYYLLMVFGWWSVTVRFKAAPGRFLRLILPWCVVAIQVVDVGPGITALHRQSTDQAKAMSPSLEPVWDDLLKKYSQISIVPSVDANEDDVPMSEDQRVWFQNDALLQLAWLASINDIALNYGFCSRSCMNEARLSTQRVRRELEEGALDSRTIYIFSTVTEWRRASVNRKANARMIDGLFVLLGSDLS
jgi:hypothetical protein